MTMGRLTEEEQADQDLAMKWANETIPSWRNTYDLIRTIRAEAPAALKQATGALREAGAWIEHDEEPSEYWQSVGHWQGGRSFSANDCPVCRLRKLIAALTARGGNGATSASRSDKAWAGTRTLIAQLLGVVELAECENCGTAYGEEGGCVECAGVHSAVVEAREAIKDPPASATSAPGANEPRKCHCGDVTFPDCTFTFWRDRYSGYHSPGECRPVKPTVPLAPACAEGEGEGGA